MRIIALAMSCFAFAVSCWSCYLSFRLNRDLSRRNMKLFLEKVDLWKKIEEYEAEILRLKNLLERKENNDETDAL